MNAQGDDVETIALTSIAMQKLCHTLRHWQTYWQT